MPKICNPIDTLNLPNVNQVAKNAFGSILRAQLMNCNDLLLLPVSNRYGLLRTGKHNCANENGNPRATQMETIYSQRDDSQTPYSRREKERQNRIRNRNEGQKAQKLCVMLVSDTISCRPCDCLRSGGHHSGGHFVHFMPDTVQLECDDKVGKLVEVDANAFDASKTQNEETFMSSEVMICDNTQTVSQKPAKFNFFNRHFSDLVKMKKYNLFDCFNCFGCKRNTEDESYETLLRF